MCVMSELREQYTRSQMMQRYSSWRSACLSAMCRFKDAFEHSTLPHRWHVNTFLGEAPATAKTKPCRARVSLLHCGNLSGRARCHRLSFLAAAAEASSPCFLALPYSPTTRTRQSRGSRGLEFCV